MMGEGFRLNQKGQTLLEYIAVLFVAVLVVLGLVYQFNDAFRKYLDAWFRADESGYLFCLIQNGYLPGESDTCPLPRFDMKSGRMAAAGIGGDRGSNGGIGGGKNGGQNAGGSGGGGGGSLAGDSGRGAGLVSAGKSFGGGGAGGAGKSGAGGGKSADSTGSTDFSSGGVAFGSNSGGSSGRRGAYGRRYVPLNADEGGGDMGGNPPIPATERDLRPQARFVTAEKGKKVELQDESYLSNMSFGKLFKIVFILFIFFSILFFVGSQIFAIARGNQKRK